MALSKIQIKAYAEISEKAYNIKLKDFGSYTKTKDYFNMIEKQIGDALYQLNYNPEYKSAIAIFRNKKVNSELRLTGCDHSYAYIDITNSDYSFHAKTTKAFISNLMKKTIEDILCSQKLL